ncbi:response regulator [Synoicihabitans lomoniglobus]|uniref:Response regulator n=1 Tax=Synoicihabitans lomoniglobus TaxID=2909285 RepID=A0AAF0CPG8_9BACT|nr:response regulator [Opitutaceae bacterium LMO-M01]WED64669.1 response regulator [Opitutaceae bacterium LMO-M01]
MISPNKRILIVDDNPAIHADFRKIFAVTARDPAVDMMEAKLFGAEPVTPTAVDRSFDLDSAYQGSEAVDMVREARDAGRPYAMVFMDVQMPPGWDGIKTTAKIWEVDPELQIVICTAYTRHSWTETLDKLGHADQILILKKPFDNIEAQQMAVALSKKWNLVRELTARQ